MKTVREMAEEAGLKFVPWLKFIPPSVGTEWQGSPETLERFAALVRAQALEEAAKVCDGRGTRPMNGGKIREGRIDDGHDYDIYESADECAEAIRALVKEK